MRAVRGRRGRPARAAHRLRRPGRADLEGRRGAVGRRGGGHPRLPGRAQDRRPGRPPQARRRRGPARPDRRARRACGVHRARRPSRPDRHRPAAGVRRESRWRSGSGATRCSARWCWSRPVGRWWSCWPSASVALPPVDADTARALIDRLRLANLLAGHRGGPPLDADGLVAALVGVRPARPRARRPARGGRREPARRRPGRRASPSTRWSCPRRSPRRQAPSEACECLSRRMSGT